MDEDLVGQPGPGWNVKDFEVGGVFDPAMLLRTAFGPWCEPVGTIEPAERHSEENREGNRKRKNKKHGMKPKLVDQ